jgi:hypothetical protein
MPRRESDSLGKGALEDGERLALLTEIGDDAAGAADDLRAEEEQTDGAGEFSRNGLGMAWTWCGVA